MEESSFKNSSQLSEVSLNFFFVDTAAMQIVLNQNNLMWFLTETYLEINRWSKCHNGVLRIISINVIWNNKCLIWTCPWIILESRVKILQTVASIVSRSYVIRTFWTLWRSWFSPWGNWKAIGIHTMDLNPGTRFSKLEICFNFILKRDLLFNNDVYILDNLPLFKNRHKN
jgi:hypothetical protein